jgi:hypothetical protein
MNTRQTVKYMDVMVNMFESILHQPVSFAFVFLFSVGLVNMFESEWNKNTKGMNPSTKGIVVVIVVVILWVIVQWIF